MTIAVPVTTALPFLCAIGNCETPLDAVARVHHSGDPNNMFLDLCQNHQGYFTEWSLPLRRR